MHRKSISLSDPVFLAGALVVASGLFHLSWMWGTSAEWSGPLSPRKPSLFGISGGITIWSIAWVLIQTLPIVAALLHGLNTSNAAKIIRQVASSHVSQPPPSTKKNYVLRTYD